MFGIFLYMEKWYIGYFQLIHKNKQKSQEQWIFLYHSKCFKEGSKFITYI